MKKFIGIFLVFAVLIFACSLAADLRTLESNLIRLHVVGASNSDADQNVKLQVRDAVTAYLAQKLEGTETMEQARAVICSELSVLEVVANDVLASAGFTDTVTVSLGKEEFPMREYDSFSLPAGVYESLRICIGSAEGKNWWCVVFPTFCLSATSDELRDTAAGAGFSDTLTDTLTEDDYEIRFWLLDCLGQFQNFFHEG